jgi:hypothetical protein
LCLTGAGDVGLCGGDGVLAGAGRGVCGWSAQIKMRRALVSVGGSVGCIGRAYSIRSGFAPGLCIVTQTSRRMPR